MCVCACVCVCVNQSVFTIIVQSRGLSLCPVLLVYMQANVNLGMVMVYTLTSAVQARLGEFAEAFGQEQEQEKRRREEEERVKEEVRMCDVTTTEK